jgi:hypothetical protein
MTYPTQVPGANYDYANGSFAWSAGPWYHVAVVRSSSNVKFYVGGSNVSGNGSGYTNTTSYSGNFNIANAVSGTVGLNG